MNPLENLIIRSFKKGDLEPLVEIDEKVLEERRRDYAEERWRTLSPGMTETFSNSFTPWVLDGAI
ncbi:MAG TPA: hypothetical protein VLK23_17020 [Thermodesulfobacteriota bacterium]|nr:hypothetical protein [Thermodesulfobacteriota bacterium]